MTDGTVRERALHAAALREKALCDEPWRLRVLYVDDRVPHVDLGSGLPRSNFILNAMAALGYRVTVYPVYPTPGAGDPHRDLDPAVTILDAGEADGFRRLAAASQGRFDLLWVSRAHNIDMVCRALADLGTTAQAFVRERVIFDSEALFALRDFIAGTLETGHGSGAALAVRMRHEARHLAQADSVVTVSEAEARLLGACGIRNVAVLGHALHPSPAEPPGFGERAGFLFIGALTQEGQPNVDSLDWLLAEAWPRVQSAIPAARLTVVGAVLPEIRARLERPSVAVLGRVADPSALFAGARVCVAPTRFAAGIPHKVHEAAMRGLPLVVTPLLADQVGWPAGTGYLTADWTDDAGFAAALCRLHEDAGLWESVQRAGLAQVAAECAPERYVARLRDLCEAPVLA